jgi:photosystem II stability/assembly factor-like uncharacterized protein
MQGIWLSDLAFVGRDTGWIAVKVTARDGSLALWYRRTAILRTRDAGRTWELLSRPILIPGGDTVTNEPKIWFADGRHGWMAGTVWHRPSGGGQGTWLDVFLTTIDGGESWVHQPNVDSSALDTSSASFAVGLYFNGQSGIAIASTAIFTTVDGGDHWQGRPQEWPLFGGVRYSRFLNAGTGFVFSGGSSGYRTTDAGQTWTGFPLPHPDYGLDIPLAAWFTSPDAGWCTGTDTCYHNALSCFTCNCGRWGCFTCCDSACADGYSSIMGTVDGGRTWNRSMSNNVPIVLPDSSLYEFSFRDIFMLNSGRGWAAGTNGVVAIYSTAGDVPPSGSMETIGTTRPTAFICGRVLIVAGLAACRATLRLYDLRGRLVWTARNYALQPGGNSISLAETRPRAGRYILEVMQQDSARRTSVMCGQ